MHPEYKNEREDGFYTRRGVKPPERTTHLTEDERDRIMADNLQNHKCEYYQEGNEIYCQEGEFRHGKRIGPNLRLDGTKNGKPILVPVGPVLRSSL